jgi:hypothetical protein
MASLVVWAVFMITAVLLSSVAHNFSVRTVRWISAITALILVCASGRYVIPKTAGVPTAQARPPVSG